ncbi:30S ribosomal protein S2, partial [Arthrospira platensis SPKY1]|nr:30S ribosomal protein S2 [Arthrospira platensis SPKY1]
GGKVLFVGTKKQAKEAVLNAAERTNMHYVTERWLGGMLTNLNTIRISINRLNELEKMAEDGVIELLPKKECASLRREKTKLHRNLDGVKNMSRIPDVVDRKST